MKVFICWSEERSKVVAEALRDWLKRVIQELKPFLSTKDIRSGKRWLSEIASELKETKFGILCLTPENLGTPWINFEAGALSKTIDDKTFVCPYLIGGLQPAEVPDPLGQFQSNLADKEGTQKLLKAINSALADRKLDESVLDDAFEKFWPDLEKVLQNLPLVTKEERPKRKVEDMIEEILDSVRGLIFVMQKREEHISHSLVERIRESLESAPAIRTIGMIEAEALERGKEDLARAAAEAYVKKRDTLKKEKLKKKAEIP